MLKTNYISQPITYAPADGYMLNLLGISTLLYPSATSTGTYYLFAMMAVSDELTHRGASRWDFNGTTGELLGETRYSVGALFFGAFFQSKTGQFYHIDRYGDAFNATDPLTLQDFGPSYQSSKYGAQYFSIVGLDETRDLIMFTVPGVGNPLNIYKFSTGQFIRQTYLPSNIVAICLQKQDFAYVLCDNGMLVLMNYFNGTISGAAKMPPSLSNNGSWANNPVQICWDATYARLLVAEQLPEVAGIPVVKIRGFSMKPYATRLCAPVPLKYPIKGQTVPVYTRIVDDCNFGIGGGLVTATVAAPGELTGGSSAIGMGGTIFEVKCGNTGSVAINCQVTVPLVTD